MAPKKVSTPQSVPDDEMVIATSVVGRFKVRSRLGPSVVGRKRNIKQILYSENFEKLPVDTATYSNIEAPPTTLPRKKYCDVTGLSAPYVDPKTRLFYHSAEIYRYLQQLPPSTIQQYLALRGAEVRLN